MTAHGERVRVRRTSRTLADGREIIYFDDSPDAPPREAVDGRPLGPRARAGQVRYDALVGDWVAIAGHRSNRTFLPPKDECPLCPTGTGTVPSEVPESSYDVVVFENRFPSYAPVSDFVPEVHSDLVRSGPALGRCEVVCFTSDHDSTFAELSPQRARTVIDAWADRTAALGAVPEVEQVFCFENRGQQIGVTLHHPHGQIYAYPYVPQRSAAILARAREHHAATGRLLGADLLEAERRDGLRVVLSGQHWTAYVPYAARWPVEVHLAPHRDVPDLPALDDDERDELAVLYLDLLQRLDRYYSKKDGRDVRLPYIAGWHQAPAKEGRDVSRLHLQVMSVLRSPSKLKYLAGSESGVGGWVNDVSPEDIAARLREVGA
ncbi:galactose-1-phosphate uridylyltransferase [Phycicoccus sp. M110.8]|uniref:galactose-1-phosphate uridylyltransferase n=1 Tax=Phycicoccus sp. M110.8 TaxID=3075433 RepID=UPI0028FD9D1E|nr:galactose-1-phosphate uridylyltransferase [Phycicoccus sp. M110.8]MDU0312806.1 galactose-1-phosphate uridylyltransferase [Phycicoccus sp. M110.8]